MGFQASFIKSSRRGKGKLHAMPSHFMMYVGVISHESIKEKCLVKSYFKILLQNYFSSVKLGPRTSDNCKLSSFQQNDNFRKGTSHTSATLKILLTSTENFGKSHTISKILGEGMVQTGGGGQIFQEFFRGLSF